MKVCPRCGFERPLDKFAPDRNRPDGLSCYCRACRNAYQREYRLMQRARQVVIADLLAALRR